MIKQFLANNITVNSIGTHMLTKVGEYFLSIMAFMTVTFYTLFEGIESLVGILVTLMVIDYMTGITSSFLDKSLSSKIGLRGVTKKVTIFLIILTSVVIDYHLNMNNLLSTATIVFYMLNESLSILENAGKIGIPIPNKLKEALEQMRKENEENEDK